MLNQDGIRLQASKPKMQDTIGSVKNQKNKKIVSTSNLDSKQLGRQTGGIHPTSAHLASDSYFGKSTISNKI